jgi:ABC-2 type transport system ATP-binding protein
MNTPLATTHLTKTFNTYAALKDVSLELPAGRVAGLLGRNGAGKTTLLHLACGLLLPTSGTCATLGRPAGELDAPELARLGVVFQEGRFLDWMSVRQQLDFHASFYPKWDEARESRLLFELELNPERKIGQLSTGDRQKLGIILGVCHHPELLLLDEPVSSLDPIARLQMLAFLLDLIREDGSTIVISSHILSDVEKIVDWVICLDGGELTTNSPLDELQEGYADWVVTPAQGRPLPARFPEPWILVQEGNTQRRRLKVKPPGEAAQAQFAAAHGVTVEKHYLNLEELFPLLLRPRKAAA